MRALGWVAAAVVVLLVAAGVAAALVLRGGGNRSPFRADDSARALAGRLPELGELAKTAMAECPRLRGGGSLPSPAAGTAIAKWPEFRGVRVYCIFESSPGGGESGGGFEDLGDTDAPTGNWAAWGPNGWSWGACGGSNEDCSDVRVSEVDSHFVKLRVIRHFAANDGYVRVEAVLKR